MIPLIYPKQPSPNFPEKLWPLFELQHQSGVVVTETLWPAKPKYLSSGLLQKKNLPIPDLKDSELGKISDFV